MTERIIEYLGYIGGQDEELGGYCEPLIIKINGEKHYVLHEMHTYFESFKTRAIKAKHSKVEFETLEELVSAFQWVQENLRIDKSLPWVETDKNCGYDIPPEEEK